MNIVKVETVSENEFSKAFKYGDIDLFVAKAFDDDAPMKHFLICSVPEIKELGVAHIQYPMTFKTEAERDSVFKGFDAKFFIDALMQQIKKNKKEQEDSNKDKPYVLNLGALVVLWVAGNTQAYIAEVSQEEPLRLKITENEKDPLHSLKDEEYVIDAVGTAQIQGDVESQQALLKLRVEGGHPLKSGLKTLGVQDGEIYTILPIQKEGGN